MPPAPKIVCKTSAEARSGTFALLWRVSWGDKALLEVSDHSKFIIASGTGYLALESDVLQGTGEAMTEY